MEKNKTRKKNLVYIILNSRSNGIKKKNKIEKEGIE